MNYSDRELLAKTIQAEAGNQGAQGMMAVGNVIMNRLGKGGSLPDVILAPGQFSPWNSVTGYAGGAQGQDMAKLKPSEQAYKTADMLLSGNYEDITGGATHFYNPSISNPAWGRDKAGGDWQTIGAHIFGKAGGYRTGKGRTMEPNQQKRTGLGGLLGLMGQGNEDTGLTPFQQFAAALDPLIMPEMRGGAAIREIGKARVAKAQQNKTIEWLSKNVSPEIAQAVKSNPSMMSGVVNAVLTKKLSPAETVVVGDKLINKSTGEVIFGGSSSGYSEEQISVMNTLRDDVRKDAERFSLLKQGWDNISTFYTNPGVVSDYALAVGFAKILDPGSVAREGEVAAVANAGSLGGALKSQIINALKGEGKLPESVRAEIAQLSYSLYANRVPEAKSMLDNYKRIAEKAGLEMRDIYGGPMFDLPKEPPRPAAKDIPMPSNWPNGQAAWDLLSDEEKKEFING